MGQRVLIFRLKNRKRAKGMMVRKVKKKKKK